MGMARHTLANAIEDGRFVGRNLRTLSPGEPVIPVWSSAFTRQSAAVGPNRLKAELRTGALSRCAAFCSRPKFFLQSHISAFLDFSVSAFPISTFYFLLFFKSHRQRFFPFCGNTRCRRDQRMAVNRYFFSFFQSSIRGVSAHEQWPESKWCQPKCHRRRNTQKPSSSPGGSPWAGVG